MESSTLKSSQPLFLLLTFLVKSLRSCHSITSPSGPSLWQDHPKRLNWGLFHVFWSSEYFRPLIDSIPESSGYSTLCYGELYNVYSLKLILHAGGVSFWPHPSPGFKASERLVCSFWAWGCQAVVTRAGCSPGLPEGQRGIPLHTTWKLALSWGLLSHLFWAACLLSCAFWLFDHLLDCRVFLVLFSGWSFSPWPSYSSLLELLKECLSQHSCHLIPTCPSTMFPYMVLISHILTNLNVIRGFCKSQHLTSGVISKLPNPGNLLRYLPVRLPETVSTPSCP